MSVRHLGFLYWTPQKVLDHSFTTKSTNRVSKTVSEKQKGEALLGSYPGSRNPNCFMLTFLLVSYWKSPSQEMLNQWKEETKQGLVKTTRKNASSFLLLSILRETWMKNKNSLIFRHKVSSFHEIYLLVSVLCYFDSKKIVLNWFYNLVSACRINYLASLCCVFSACLDLFYLLLDFSWILLIPTAVISHCRPALMFVKNHQHSIRHFKLESDWTDTWYHPATGITYKETKL